MTLDRPSGMGRLFARTSFLPSLALNICLERLTSRQWYNAIDKCVILGALPFKNMTNQLKNEGVCAVVSMNEDYELDYLSNNKKAWDKAGVNFLQLSTTDMFEAPCQEKLKKGVQFIVDNWSTTDTTEGDSRVYVHCKAGRTRSATLVACYLMKVYGLTPSEAVAEMKERRPHIWLGRAQLEAIDIYHQNKDTPEYSVNGLEGIRDIKQFRYSDLR